MYKSLTHIKESHLCECMSLIDLHLPDMLLCASAPNQAFNEHWQPGSTRYKINGYMQHIKQHKVYTSTSCKWHNRSESLVHLCQQDNSGPYSAYQIWYCHEESRSGLPMIEASMWIHMYPYMYPYNHIFKCSSRSFHSLAPGKYIARNPNVVVPTLGCNSLVTSRKLSFNNSNADSRYKTGSKYLPFQELFRCLGGTSTNMMRRRELIMDVNVKQDYIRLSTHFDGVI